MPAVITMRLMLSLDPIGIQSRIFHDLTAIKQDKSIFFKN